MPENERPWGRYETLYRDGQSHVKRIEVKPGMRFSLQKHAKRAENWVIVSGLGVVTLNGREFPVGRGSVIEVGRDEIHRLHNTGAEPLIFIEVQIGDYFGEDDIVRIEDDFRRT